MQIVFGSIHKCICHLFGGISQPVRCAESVSSRVVPQLVPLSVLATEVHLLERDLDFAEEEVFLESVAVPDGHVEGLVAQHLEGHAAVLKLQKKHLRLENEGPSGETKLPYHFHERRVAVFPDYLCLSLRLLVGIRAKVDLQREEMEGVRPWLPNGYSQIFRLYSFGPSRFPDGKI